MGELRRIGLLGGMSWESTALYYRLVNEDVRSRLGGFHSARLVLASVDFAEVEAMQVAGDWSGAGELLAAEARGLEAAGAECVVLCTNTMHKVADVIEAAVGIPLLHLADVTAHAIRGAGLERVALLGTRFTMEQPFYADRLRSHGIDVLVPEGGDLDLGEVDRGQHQPCRVEAAQPVADLLVDEPVVERGALPAHPAQQADPPQLTHGCH